MQLVINNLSKSYGTKESNNKVLDNISFEIEKGQICTIIGPSGSGKSTLLNIIGGLDYADSGRIVFDDEELTAMNKTQLGLYRRNNLGFIFQFYNLIPNLTAKENIEVCQYLSKDAIEIDELLETLELSNHASKFPNEMSGGQQQRVAIARALVKNPKLLLCDEPTGALDYKNSKEVLRLIERLNKKYGTTIVIVTHNTAISHMSNVVLKLKDGKIDQLIYNTSVESADNIDW
ncbi:ABC transporter ATP-binding protein [Clostridium zeae]|uniref:ABC transporter ATP-binding protein n=1 Tax=Clostridium zeae TaxID=2759022 RepID=A0ABQ1E810_9CLOT|nr:ABC transporter ATP-binding protein [Clostridium zeae]GFZ30866.1 ABC transporter ATP-binding protein [Clostridium zeae]